MKVFENQTFEMLNHREAPIVFSDVEFRNCTFDNCSLPWTHNPARRATVRNIVLKDCRQHACYINTAVLEDVVVDSLACSSRGPLFTFGTVFNRVTLRGKIGLMVINNEANPSSLVSKAAQDAEIAAFRAANEAFYKNVEWALDISQGLFSTLDFRNFPCHLIRRDPETQFLFKRENVVDKRWLDFELEEGVVSWVLSGLSNSGRPDQVIVAGRRSKKFKSLLRDLQFLRNEGIAEPD